MDPRTSSPDRRGRAAHSRRRPSAVRRPELLLGMAAAGALMANVLIAAQPAAQADAAPVSVAQQLALTARSTPAQETVGFRRLEQSASSRGDREAAQLAAQQAQAAADQAVLDRQRAEAEAAAAAQAAAEAEAARVAAEAAARAAAESAAAAQATSGQQAQGSQGTAAAAQATARAQITNNAGSVEPQVQAAADLVLSNVPGADGITLGGTRASAADPGGHPSGLALDYMVMTDDALGDAIVEYHLAHWDSLGVDYIIWEQRYLASPNGSWKQMEDRGGVTANHYDHVHVNYRG